MSIVAEFAGFRLRISDQLSDVHTLDDWIEADEAHRGIYTPFFFMGGKLAEDPRSTCYALEDEKGVVFYIRISRVARVRIQFSPEQDAAQRKRVMAALFHGMSFLESIMGATGVEEWIFDTENPELKNAAERHLGFTPSSHELVRLIVDPRKPARKEDA